jgi:hypothetical protein
MEGRRNMQLRVLLRSTGCRGPGCGVCTSPCGHGCST